MAHGIETISSTTRYPNMISSQLPDRCVVDVEIALLQQFLNIAQRKRIAKIPPDGTKDETGFGLPPFEDRVLGSHSTILSPHQPATLKVATHPSEI
jgi:hypothetical protein